MDWSLFWTIAAQVVIGCGIVIALLVVVGGFFAALVKVMTK